MDDDSSGELEISPLNAAPVDRQTPDPAAGPTVRIDRFSLMMVLFFSMVEIDHQPDTKNDPRMRK